MRRIRPPKAVLYIDDDDRARRAIEESFQRAANRYAFSATCIASTKEYIDLAISKKQFDVFIVDLHFDRLPAPEDFAGFRLIAGQAYERPGALIVVYSAYDQPSRIVRAIRSGATSFISKTEVQSTNELVSQIEKLFDDQEARFRTHRTVRQFMRSKGPKWCDRQQGQTVAFVGNRIVARGSSRLEVLVKYAGCRESKPNWPEEPYLVEFPRLKGGAC